MAMETMTPAAESALLDSGKALDAVCKRVLSQKPILAWIMKACVTEYAGMEAREIEKYIEGAPQVGEAAVLPDQTNHPVIQGLRNEDTSLTEGIVTYDIRFRATVPNTAEKIGLIINIEAQSNSHPGYPLLKRGIYYCSRMISAQHGREFTKSHYGQLKKVYSIWVCTDAPEKEQNTITQYVIQERNLIGQVNARKEDYDLLNVTMLCLGDKVQEEVGALQLLYTLLISRESYRKKLQMMSEDYHIAITEPMEQEVSQMCNISQGIASKNRAEGRAEGRAEERLEMVRNLMQAMAVSAVQAMDLLRIPPEQRPALLEKLQQ